MPSLADCLKLLTASKVKNDHPLPPEVTDRLLRQERGYFRKLSKTLPVEEARKQAGTKIINDYMGRVQSNLERLETSLSNHAKRVATSVEPAIKTPSGEVVTGEDHVSAYEEAKKTTPDTSGSKEGFVDENGKFLSREEAAQKTGLPTETEPGKLHSSDLPKEPEVEWDHDALRKLHESLGEEEPERVIDNTSAEPPKEPSIDTESLEKAVRGIPGSLGDAVRDVVLEGKTPEEAAGTHGATVRAVRDTAERMRRYAQDLAKRNPAEEAPESTAEVTPSESEKPVWQKTKAEVLAEDGSVASHRIAVRKAVGDGEKVPLEVLEDYDGSHWADAARKKLYGEHISDGMLAKILKKLENEPGGLYSDPFFLQSIGKPVLRATIKLIQEGIEAGKLGRDVFTDALNYMKEHIPNLDEQKARDFLNQYVKPKTVSEEPAPTTPSVEVPPESGQLGVAETDSPAATTEPPQELNPKGATGIKNAIVDAERAEREIAPRAIPAKRGLEAINQAASDAFAKDANVGKGLVEELSNGIRPLTDVEDAILTREQAIRQQQFDRAVSNVNDAVSDSERTAAQNQLREAREELFEIYDVGQKAGTENGRGLNARRLMIKDDYSLANIENRARAANGGKSLEGKEGEGVLDQLKQANDRIQVLEKQMEENKVKYSDESAKHYFDKLLKETKKSVSSAAKQGRTFTDFITDQADAARARIRARTGTAFAAVDPTVIYDVAVIGAEKITKGLNKLSEWSADMIREFGPNIKPHLEQIFDKSKQFHEATESAFPKPPEEKAINLSGLKQRDVYELVKQKIESGITKFDEVMKAVHEDFAAGNPDLTEREVRDAFTEYGKAKFPSKDAVKIKLSEYRRLGQLVSAIEDAQKGEAPKKTGMQRSKPTLDIREKMKELKVAMDAAGIETQDPESQLASTNQARATALRNSIEDLDKQLKTGEKPQKGQPVPTTAEVEELTSIRDAMREKLQEIENAANPPKSPEEARLDTYKKNLKRQIEELNKQQQGAPAKVRNATKLDDEARKLQARRNEERQKVDKIIYDLEQSKRPTYQKWLEQMAGAARFSALSGYHTLGKLLGFSLARAGIETPLNEFAGAALAKTPGLRNVFAAAPLEAGSTLESLGKFYSGMATKGLKEAARVMKKGSSELKSAYGKPELQSPKWYDFFGALHAAEKTPLLVGAHEMFTNRLFRDAAKNGLDINNEFVRAEINKEAFERANREILQNKNFASTMINMGHSWLEKIDPKTGNQSLTKSTISNLLKTFITKGIIKTPANYIMQTLERTPVGLIAGLSETMMANRRGILNLKPVEANAIARLLKVGSVGSALFLLGLIDGTRKKEDRIFGGYWEPGRERDDGDVPWGQIRIGGHVIPHLLTHNPLTESAQMGATMSRVWKSKLRKKDIEDQGPAAGAIQAMVGLASKAPIASPLMRSAQQRNPTIGTDIVTGLIPQLLQNVAEDIDTAQGKERAPQDTSDRIKMAIPGLRQQVPEKTKKRAKRARSRAWQ